MSDDNEYEYESEPEDPEGQSLTLANSLHVLIYGLFALAVVAPLLSCLGLWPAMFVAGPFSWFLICGPSVSIVFISRWYVGAILAALGLPFCCTGWSGYVYKLLSGVVGLC